MDRGGPRSLPASLQGESFCYLTTAGRSTGAPHTIEIWFALRETTLYMLSGGRDGSDWVRNLVADPHVQVRIGQEHFHGRARVMSDPQEDAWARRALVEKYQESYGGDLMNWGRASLPIAVDLDARPSKLE